MLRISQLFIYPIKSLGGIGVLSAEVTRTGFLYDRQWMLVDSHLRFITQREMPQMALLQVGLTDSGLQVYHKKHPDHIFSLPFSPPAGGRVTVTIFEETCEAVYASREADTWFSAVLGTNCRLVYMPEDARRYVDTRYAIDNDSTGFADGYPYLIIGQASLDDLNNRLSQPLAINRFRPNIVFTGGLPFEEDAMEQFTVDSLHFFGVKPCARCAITTVNQEEGTRNKEPLKTLATYRQVNNKIFFGQNLIARAVGTIKVGDMIKRIKMSGAVNYGLPGSDPYT